jgi:hypothetical protein
VTYKHLFDEEFKYIEDRPQKLDELIEDIRQMKKEAEENKKNEEMIEAAEKMPEQPKAAGDAELP